ncbi:RICIN domain-containing protein [Streptomyces marincola]|uniref:RICIN domain-containing protein n=1 Tax=Streptomyces marincola TaxID=2878388 RepID=UPI001CF4BDEC|nr:RICIN domain-containing protein [Streptomyces marincola]UCM89257.1 ricin-type beta-trefoil lectin domain protein [Streptomyces marincola]
MAHVIRKLLVLALLALPSFALPSAAQAAHPAADDVSAAVGVMCLSTDFGTTRIVSVQECDSRPGQQWTVSGSRIYQSLNPGMCLSTDFGTTRIVSVQPCDSRPGQNWTVNGTTIYQSLNPGMCLATDYGRTRMVFVEGCNSSGPRQHWTIQGQQISLTY